MITKAVELLNMFPYYNVSESVEIAKGKNELPSNFKELKNHFLRKYKYKK